MSNTITITGRLAQDPEMRFTSSGKAMCNLSIPDQKRTKGDSGQWEDASATTWFRVTVWGEQAEALAEHARKGDEVVVTGRLITREWTDKEGGTRSSLEVDFAKVGFTPGGARGQRQQPAQQQNQPQPDPWGQPQQGGGFGQGSYDQPPF